MSLNATALLSIQQAQARFAALFEQFRGSVKHKAPDLSPKTFEVIKAYELLVSDLYRLRAQCPPHHPTLLRMEDYVATVSHELTSLRQVKNPGGGYAAFVSRYRRVWRENFSVFIFIFVVFVASALLGWHITLVNSNHALAFVSQPMLEKVLYHEAWFESIQQSPVQDGIYIAWNNIRVALNCFLLGALLGIGGLLILSYNGLMLGAILAFCYLHDFDQALIRFVVGHGPLELTIIIASAFGSFLIGRVFYMRPYRLFRSRFSQAVRESKDVMLGVLPWLLLAAFIEVFVSPWPQFPFAFKLGVSLSCTCAFWAWTLWPAKTSSYQKEVSA